MPLDLRKLQSGSGQPKIEPRDIFASLADRPWPRLRVEQDQVLKAWFQRRREQDLVIKQNTGSGKTVVGLLIAQASLNEGNGPAAYVVPDTYLVDQVLKEANALGLSATINPRSHEFISGNAILICTFERVVNGRTVFGLAGDPYARTIGTIVIDDAHSALGAARRQFTLDISPDHEAYDKALSVFGDELKRQSPKHAALLAEGDRSAALRIPFWSWSRKYTAVMDELRPSAENEAHKGIYYSWPLLADHLKLAVATISSRGLQIRTPCPPIQLIPAFHLAKRRIYLTATLSDDGVLVTNLAADPESVRTPITPERATDLGDRLILAPRALSPETGDDSIRQLAWQFSHGDRDGDDVVEANPVNVVVLVPSFRAAENWQKYADETLHVKNMKPVVDRMSEGEHLGLVVLVNKYDGVDLPHDACRLLVLDGAPTHLDPGEQREAAALAGSDSLRVRRIQKIEQGMGRGIRDAEDHCAVLLLGNSLALSLVDPADLETFSPATRAQMVLSQSLADQIKGEGLSSVREALDLFLSRDPQWKAASSNATAGVAYESTGHVSAVAAARRKSWDLAFAGDPGEAFRVLRESLDEVDSIERGWRLEEAAAYQHEVSPEDAQKTIRAAKQANSHVLMPAFPLPNRPVKGRAQQGVASSQFLTERYSSGTELRLQLDMILDDLAFEPGEERTGAAEAALKQLGLHLGFDATRPEKESKGPDGCWGLAPGKTAVFELKTGTERSDETIVKSETDQLSGAVSWDQEVNQSESCIPVLIAKTATLHKLSSAPRGTRVITRDKLNELKEDVRAFAADVSGKDQAWTRPETVRSALQRHGLTFDQIVPKHSSPIVPADV